MSQVDADTSVMLLARLRSRPVDPDAWQRFVHAYAPRVMQWCRHWGMQENDARDVVQTVLLRFWNQSPRFEYDVEGSFRGWLRKLAYYAWCDFVEQQQQRRKLFGHVSSTLESVTARDDLITRLEDQFDLELLDIAMERVRTRVRPQTWDAFRLLALDGVSGQEVAQQLGMKLGSAFASRSKVQRMIHDELRELDDDFSDDNP